MNKVYQEIKDKKPEKLHLDLKYIIQQHIGAGNAVSKEELCKRLFGKHNDAYDRVVRNAVSELVIYFDEPIVTNTAGGGFYYPQTPDEIDENIKDISSRITQLEARRDGLKRARTKRFHKGYKDGVQAQLFFQELPQANGRVV